MSKPEMVQFLSDGSPGTIMKTRHGTITYKEYIEKEIAIYTQLGRIAELRVGNYRGHIGLFLDKIEDEEPEKSVVKINADEVRAKCNYQKGADRYVSRRSQPVTDEPCYLCAEYTPDVQRPMGKCAQGIVVGKRGNCNNFVRKKR